MNGAGAKQAGCWQSWAHCGAALAALRALPASCKCCSRAEGLARSPVRHAQMVPSTNGCFRHDVLLMVLHNTQGPFCKAAQAQEECNGVSKVKTASAAWDVQDARHPQAAVAPARRNLWPPLKIAT